MPDDPRVLQQALDAAFVPARDPLELEVGEGCAEVLALAQDREPGEPGLEALEAELLEELAIVVYRKAPLGVVVGLVVGVVATPPTTSALLRHPLAALEFGAPLLEEG